MYSQVESLVVTLSRLLADVTDAEEHRECLLKFLRGIHAADLPRRQELLVSSAMQFIESSAWSLLWNKIRWSCAMPGGAMSGSQLIDLDTLLKDHFSAIEELTVSQS